MAGPWDRYASSSSPTGPWTKYDAGNHVHPDDVAAMPDPGLPVPGTPTAQVGPTTVPFDPMRQDKSGGSSNALHDTAAQGISGLHEGIASTLSLPNNLISPFLKVGPTVVNALTGSKFSTNTDYLPDAGKAYLSLGNDTGFIKPPDHSAGNQAVRTVGRYLGGMILPGEAALGAGAPLGAVGRDLVSGLGAGLGAAGANAVAPGNPWAELAGSIIGGATPSVVTSIARKIVTPNPASPERLDMANTLDQQGVDLTAGQKTGSKALQYSESELGGAASKSFMEQQSKQFTKAALQQAGISADAATPAVMSQAFSDIGDEFDGLAARTSTPFDQKLQNDMLQTVDNYQHSAAAPAKAVEAIVNRAGELAANSNGILTGDDYQALRSKIGEYMRGADSSTKMALGSLQTALDDAVERNLPPGSPLIGDWQQARGQYRNMLVIQQAASGSGASAAMGQISPAQLASAAKMIEGKAAWVRGRGGNIDELARAGVSTMSPLPDSGTSSRLSARAIASVPATIGGLVGSGGGLPGMVGGAVLGAAVPMALGRSMLSDVGRGYLGNQAWLPSQNLSPGVALTSQTSNAMRGFNNTMTLEDWMKQNPVAQGAGS